MNVRTQEDVGNDKVSRPSSPLLLEVGSGDPTYEDGFTMLSSHTNNKQAAKNPVTLFPSILRPTTMDALGCKTVCHQVDHARGFDAISDRKPMSTRLISKLEYSLFRHRCPAGVALMRIFSPINPLGCVAVALLFSFGAATAAQPPAVRRTARQQQEMQKRAQQQIKEAAENQPVLPNDPQLLSLHREFITKAEKLATEYERKKQFDRAREVYESLVRLVPKYDKAEEGLKRILMTQAMKERKLTEVLATREWQDSGATIQQGMPVHFEVKGTWKVVYETGPEGVRIPDEMRPRNSRIQLGTLIGAIVTNPAELTDAKPFIVTSGQDLIADKTGRLYLRMFDVDPTDNEGKIYVMIQSTFAN